MDGVHSEIWIDWGSEGARSGRRTVWRIVRGDCLVSLLDLCEHLCILSVVKKRVVVPGRSNRWSDVLNTISFLVMKVVFCVCVKRPYRRGRDGVCWPLVLSLRVGFWGRGVIWTIGDHIVLVVRGSRFTFLLVSCVVMFVCGFGCCVWIVCFRMCWCGERFIRYT